MIRLVDQTVVIDLETVEQLRITDFALEILAHEIGHHVYAPASVTEHTRSLARMRRALPTVEASAPMICNLYTDLLINDRLQRSAGLRMADLMRRLTQSVAPVEISSLWQFYQRTYELLWAMTSGELVAKMDHETLEGDARLAARLVRHYSQHWLDGVSRYGVLALPYLLESKSAASLAHWHDTRDAGLGGDPQGLTEIDAADIVHPAFDETLSGISRDRDDIGETAKPTPTSGRGQTRTPYEFGEILRLAGLRLSPEEAAIRYYEELARPYLVPFPTMRLPESIEPLMEGTELWEIGDPIAAIDWRESLLKSPTPIAGMTLVKRVFGTVQGQHNSALPLDLDLYVDSSGSMPDPRVVISWPALAGAVICLSALRAGARVAVHLWSDKKSVASTNGFVRDARDCLRVLVGYFGGGTQFPLPLLRDLHSGRKKLLRPTHILVVSDDGASTMFDSPDEKGHSGLDVCRQALLDAGGGGTLALNLPDGWESLDWAALNWIKRARDEQGWQIAALTSLEDLLAFARVFSNRHYQGHDVISDI